MSSVQKSDIFFFFFFPQSQAVVLREVLPCCVQEQEVRLDSQPWCSQSIKREDSILLRKQAVFYFSPLRSGGTGIDEWARRRKNLRHNNCCWCLYVMRISGCKYAHVQWLSFLNILEQAHSRSRAWAYCNTSEVLCFPVPLWVHGMWQFHLCCQSHSRRARGRNWWKRKSYLPSLIMI